MEVLKLRENRWEAAQLRAKLQALRPAVRFEERSVVLGLFVEFRVTADSSTIAKVCKATELSDDEKMARDAW